MLSLLWYIHIYNAIMACAVNERLLCVIDFLCLNSFLESHSNRRSLLHSRSGIAGLGSRARLGYLDQLPVLENVLSYLLGGGGRTSVLIHNYWLIKLLLLGAKESLIRPLK